MTEPEPDIVVEFYGLPRRQAGRAELTVQARTACEALQAVAAACPALSGLCHGVKLDAHYLVSLDGKRFITNLNERLSAGTRLLILGADAGG